VRLTGDQVSPIGVYNLFSLALMAMDFEFQTRQQIFRKILNYRCLTHSHTLAAVKHRTKLEIVNVLFKQIQ
jgi:hypothetical protein